jgi:hypothetical protein
VAYKRGRGDAVSTIKSSPVHGSFTCSADAPYSVATDTMIACS